MRAAPLLLVIGITILGGCAHPLSFTVVPTESRAIGWPPTRSILTAASFHRRARRLYAERWYPAPVPSRCLVRFVYGPSGFVGAARNLRSNVIVLELVPAPPRPTPPSDEPHLPE